MTHDIVVLGAGIAGLSCAAELARAGRHPVVLDRAKGVGGRCATRRVEGQAVDHGVVFLHGSDPEFLAAIENVAGGTRLDGWPGRVHGTGAPCQPDAFAGGERRIAFVEGVSVLAKHLARGLDVRLEQRVVSLLADEDGIRLRTEDGSDHAARTAVLALAVEQAIALLDTIQPVPAALALAARLLRMMGTVPCLTVIAGYPAEAPDPPWDVSYPETSIVLQLVSNDSAKRRDPRFRVMVYQARPHWSRQRLDQRPDEWAAEILAEAAHQLGEWAARPLWTQAHRWRYARTERGSELSGPLLLSLPGGGRLGFAGEVFAPGGGVEAAWSSGRTLARQILEKESS